MSGGPARSRSPSSSAPGGDQGSTLRVGRAGYRTTELNTIPVGVRQTVAQAADPGTRVNLLSNFIRIKPMTERKVVKYRVEIEPALESTRIKRQILRMAVEPVFTRQGYEFDGGFDLRSSVNLPQDETEYQVTPAEGETSYKITLKKQSDVLWGSLEMVRLYNMNMKSFLRALGFFQMNMTGAYLHPSLANQVGENRGLVTMRGYRTSVNIHKNDDILMNLESVHKLMQMQNCCQMMKALRGDRPLTDALMVGRLVIPSYNRRVYRVEEVNWSMKPSSTFPDRRSGRDITYIEYYRTRYALEIKDEGQPLLLVTAHNARRGANAADQEQETPNIYLVPEFCNLTGLTDQQRNDFTLKRDLIQSSQLSPKQRVEHLNTFLQKFHQSEEIRNKLASWGYSYANEAVQVPARILTTEGVCVKGCGPQHENWPRVQKNGDFERVMVEKGLLQAPTIHKLCIVITRADANNEQVILERISAGFRAVHLDLPPPANRQVVRIREGDSAQNYLQYLRQLSSDLTIAIVVMKNQNKERYDAIKKLCTVERGMVTQVVTSKLLLDDRKQSGACKKIAIQIAAKIGGEPWRVHLPLSSVMICGYDTYHDTAQRGRSYGAFIASMNKNFSRWFSRADRHDQLDELSSQISGNMVAACQRWRELNGGNFPERVYLYRDGVGDGQLEQVYNVELKMIQEVLKKLSPTIKLAMIIVNKRIGARFYAQMGGNNYDNPNPGTVIDSVVTRKCRYDFYLISQSTRNGTISPTYYNIIHDETQLDAGKHQAMAYKLCLMYYNWTGTVRVPAPCQYAHKLALLCGEHLHSAPNAALENLLHFL